MYHYTMMDKIKKEQEKSNELFIIKTNKINGKNCKICLLFWDGVL